MCTITQRNKHWISHFTARPFFLRRMFRPFFYFCTSPGLQGRALSAGLLFFFLSHPGNQNKKLTNSGRQKNINLAGTKQIYMDNTSPVFFGRREATKKNKSKQPTTAPPKEGALLGALRVVAAKRAQLKGKTWVIVVGVSRKKDNKLRWQKLLA